MMNFDPPRAAGNKKPSEGMKVAARPSQPLPTKLPEKPEARPESKDYDEARKKMKADRAKA